MKFTFKKTNPTGSYASFFDPHYDIKLKKHIVGMIDPKKPHKIRLMVIKDDINEDGNPNCSWKWIKLKKDFNSIDEVKIFLNENIELILKKFKLYMSGE